MYPSTFQMDASMSPETPFVMKRTAVDENFIQLQIEPVMVVSTTKQYLERQILRSKIQKTLNVDNYVINMKKYEDPMPFYMTSHNPQKLTYLTSQHFSLGLLKADPGTRHEIKNVTYSVPLYVFVCSGEERSRFSDRVNKGLALVNKTWITTYFQMQKVLPAETFPIPDDSVYFFFTTSHSKFVMEQVASISTVKVESETEAQQMVDMK